MLGFRKWFIKIELLLFELSDPNIFIIIIFLPEFRRFEKHFLNYLFSFLQQIFIYCTFLLRLVFLGPPVHDVPTGNPCVPSPCGPNSQCRVIGNTPACSCLPNYIGRPPNCRPECTINAECPGNLACINERCKDPCPGSCGYHATCIVVSNTPHCSCEPGFTGDPFTGCTPIPLSKPFYSSNLWCWLPRLVFYSVISTSLFFW